MLFPNPAKALTEMRRVVKPGGKVAVIVYSALERILTMDYLRNCSRFRNIPPPAPGEPWMYALGDPGALEDLYRRAGFLNAVVHAVPLPRLFPSAADAMRRMRNSAGDLRELMSRLNEAEGARTWVEIEEQLRRFEGPNGLKGIR